MRRYKLGGVLIFLSIAMMSGCVSIGKQTMTKNKDILKSHADLSGKNMLSHCQHEIALAEKLKEQLIKPRESKDALKTLDFYNQILVHVDDAMGQAGLLSQVHPDESIRKEGEKCEQLISGFITDLSLDRAVYDALKACEKAPLDAEATRVLERTLRDFRRAGVDRDEKTRLKIRMLKEELVKLGQEFGQNIRDERFVIKLKNKSDLEGLPEDYIKSHKPGPDGMIDISTDYPDYIPFMSYAKNNNLRKELRFKYLNRGQKNGPILRKLIEKRNELAKLLNYNSYADYIVEDKMIKETKKIHSFIDHISQIAKAGADKEYASLLKFKQQSDKNSQQIEGHESAYLEQAYKKAHYNFDAQSVRPYFSYNRVRDGLLAVTSKLFNINYRPVVDAQVWDSSVETYDIYDENTKLGRIYLDMHPREGKYKHAAQFTARSGLKNQQYPEGALVCNFPNPQEGDGSALMEHRQVVTMFHEFGHLLHHIFSGKQNWMPFSGVATEWDFVEAPSQFLEEWAWSPEVLAMFALHYKSKEPISADLVKKMRAADEFGKAISARQQLFYAALSADYYNLDPQSFDMLEHLKELQAKYSYFPYEAGTNFHHSFGHLDGYSAMYYTYMWSLTIAKDLLEPFKRVGLMNSEQAGRFRDIILKRGGSQDAEELVQEFLGRPFNFDAFEKWLKTDAETAT
jgi:thimet oligopeptidase